jgi:hypothetical protein
VWTTGAHLAIGIACLLAWFQSGADWWLDYYFHYQGAMFFVCVGFVDLMLCWKAWSQFEPDETLRSAWLLIALASLYRVAGYLFSQILSVDSLINPHRLFSASWDSGLAITFRQYGMIVSGPLQMAVLAWGLFIVLRTYRRLGILGRLKSIDLLLIAAVSVFTLRQLYEINLWLQATGRPDSLYKVLGWASDPLLSILLVEAILIRRAVLETGWGLIAKCWGALMVAIVITSLGDVGLWATSHNYIPWPFETVTWYVWYPASAAFALAPAYQLEAVHRACNESPVSVSVSPRRV